MTQQFDFFLPCAKGVQTLLSQELKAFSLHIERETASGIMVRADIKTAMRLCLWSRLTNRVLMHLGVLDAENSKSLYDTAHAFAWDGHFDLEKSILIQGHGENKSLRNSHYSALRLKDAIVDFFQKKYGARPNVDKNAPDIQLHLFIRGIHADVYLDFSGESLHRRGYREKGAYAPLKETLAACLLAATSWPEICRAQGSFVDPMCGSGTLAIEALMQACDMAPGLLRKRFGFEAWKQFQPESWRSIESEARDRFEAGHANLKNQIIAYDIDADMVKTVQRSLARLGLSDKIIVKQQAMKHFQWPEDASGLLLMNPPYGHRMGEVHELRQLYQNINKIMQEKPDDWHIGIFTADTHYESSQTLEASKKYHFYNGRLKSQLYYYK